MVLSEVRSLRKGPRYVCFRAPDAPLGQTEQLPTSRKPLQTQCLRTEREGFEPSVQLPAHRISSAVP